jgi:hypothetical protein
MTQNGSSSSLRSLSAASSANIRALFRGSAVGAAILATVQESDTESDDVSPIKVLLEDLLVDEEKPEHVCAMQSGDVLESRLETLRQQLRMSLPVQRHAQVISPFDVPEAQDGEEDEEVNLEDELEEWCEDESGVPVLDQEDRMRRVRKQEAKRVKRLVTRIAASKVTLSKACPAGLNGLAVFAYRFRPVKNYDYRLKRFSALPPAKEDEGKGYE